MGKVFFCQNPFLAFFRLRKTKKGSDDHLARGVKALIVGPIKDFFGGFPKSRRLRVILKRTALYNPLHGPNSELLIFLQPSVSLRRKIHLKPRFCTNHKSFHFASGNSRIFQISII